MEIKRRLLNDVLVLKPFMHSDNRGTFVKPFNVDAFRELGISFAIKEEFFSVSRRDTLRGMHFQVPPHAHNKLVYCVAGEVLDVVVDLRRSSTTYGQCEQIYLRASDGLAVYIPVGFAHGFLALSDDSCLIYKTDAVYERSHDTGIHWRSLGFDWPTASPLVSERDESFPDLSEYQSPFDK